MRRSDDDGVPVTRLGDDGEPDEEAERPAAPRDWQRTALVVSVIVAAVALSISAWAATEQRRLSQRHQCLIEAQLLAFGPLAQGRQEDVLREKLAECGVEVPPAG